MQTKKCTKCGEVKPLSEFHKNAGWPDGLNSSCRECVNLRRRERYHSRREVMLQGAKRSRAARREQITDYKSEYRRTHRDEIVSYLREYYVGHLQEYTRRSKEHRRAISGTWRCFFYRTWGGINARTTNGSNPRPDIPNIRRYLDKGIRLEMTREEYRSWCESQADLIARMYAEAEAKGDPMLRPSIDRIDSDGHYALGNVQVISRRDNCSKGKSKEIDEREVSV
jgi:hypothetical protein